MPKAKKPTKRTLKSLAVLAVDPGAKFGAVLRLRHMVVSVWHGKQSLEAVAGIIASSMRIVDDCTAEEERDKYETPLVLACENQFTGRPGGGKKSAPFNPKAVASLLKRRHEWEIIAELRGIAYSAVYPASWQSILKISPAIGGSTKTRAKALCDAKWPGLKLPTEDAMDAACLSYWYDLTQMREYV